MLFKPQCLGVLVASLRPDLYRQGRKFSGQSSLDMNSPLGFYGKEKSSYARSFGTFIPSAFSASPRETNRDLTDPYSKLLICGDHVLFQCNLCSLLSWVPMVIETAFLFLDNTLCPPAKSLKELSWCE